MLLEEKHCLGGQYPAIRHAEGPAIVIAGPGSGKTTVLANRSVHLARAGIDPKRILILTFNASAAQEMAERAVTLFREANLPLWEDEIKTKDGETKTIEGAIIARTYHSFGWAILKEVIDVNPWEAVLVKAENLVKDILGPSYWVGSKGGGTTYEGMGWNYGDQQQIDPKTALRLIEDPQEKMIVPSKIREYYAELLGPAGEVEIDCKSETEGKWKSRRTVTQLDLYVELYERFHAELKRRRKVVFSDMLYGAWLVLTNKIKELGTIYQLKPDAAEKCKTALSRWRATYDYIMVDEAQDTNPLQGEVVTMLAAQHQNILVVGDPDQSIYAFRGSVPEYIMGLMNQQFRGHQVYNLDYTRRSVPQVVEVANKLIGNNPRLDHYKPLQTSRAHETGSVTAHQFLGGEAEQARVFAEDIAGLIGDDPQRADTIGVIYRTHATGATIEPALFSKGVPFRVLGGGSAFNRKEIRVAMAFIRSLVGIASADDVCECANVVSVHSQKTTNYLGIKAFDAFKQWAAQPGIIETDASAAVVKLTQMYKMPSWFPYNCDKGFRNWLTLLDNMLNENPWLPGDDKYDPSYQTLKQDRTSVNFVRVVRAWAVDRYVTHEYGERDDDGDSIFEVLIGLEHLAAEHPDPRELCDIVKKLQDDASKPVDERSPAVTLGTAHRWKGLERETIYILGMDDGVWPHKKAEGYAEDGMDPGYQASGICEERRLAFVAVTRAKNDLHIGFYINSLFVAEMGLTPVIEDEELADIIAEQREALLAPAPAPDPALPVPTPAIPALTDPGETTEAATPALLPPDPTDPALPVPALSAPKTRKPRKRSKHSPKVA